MAGLWLSDFLIVKTRRRIGCELLTGPSPLLYTAGHATPDGS